MVVLLTLLAECGEGAAQIAVPALVSTLCICIVFLPMFFLGGVARYLFVPLAEAVVFAMLASYILSRTLVPTLVLYLLRDQPAALVVLMVLASFLLGAVLYWLLQRRAAGRVAASAGRAP